MEDLCAPEEVGISSEKLSEMNDDIVEILAQNVDFNSVLIVKNGYIVAEQYYSSDYGANTLHSIYFCTKSITSALIGTAIQKGHIIDENQTIGFCSLNCI